MHLTRVDLPAPLSPSRARTSPGMHVKVHIVQGDHGPEQLVASRTSNAEDRSVEVVHGRSCESRLQAAEPVLEVRPDHVQLDGHHDHDDAGGDVLPVRVDAEQVQPVVDARRGSAPRSARS